MKKFTVLKGVMAMLPMINIDTDAIIPKQFLKTIKRTGLGRYLFNDLRFDADGKEIPSFVLNKPRYRSASILVTGANFGCGSSREHAPWALEDFGIRCVIAPSFADIFFNNCFKNGLLPIILPESDVARLTKVAVTSDAEIVIDLEAQRITGPDGIDISFSIDPFRKHCLLNGLDDISLTEQNIASIEEYEKKISNEQPWI